MPERYRILFLCTASACRSQMAEGWARVLKGDRIDAYSAGVAPRQIDPRAVRVMAQARVDISGLVSKHVDELRDVSFGCVVTVCDHAAESRPGFPGAAGSTGGFRIRRDWRRQRQAKRRFCPVTDRCAMPFARSSKPCPRT